MTLMRRSPTRTLQRFGDPFGAFLDVFDETLPSFFRDSEASTAWTPAVDIVERDQEVVVRAELPGVDKKGIGVEIKDNILTLKGEKREENETKEDNYHRMERRFGSFQRSFTLPESLDRNGIRAEHKNGVLEIHIPKREEVQAKKIPIH